MSALILKVLLTALHLGGIALGAGSAVLGKRLQAAERLEAAGLALTALSGVGLILLHPAAAHAPAFPLKMAVMAVLAANLLLKRAGQTRLSIAAWAFAVILGGLRDQPFPVEAATVLLIASFGLILMTGKRRTLTMRAE